MATGAFKLLKNVFKMIKKLVLHFKNMLKNLLKGPLGMIMGVLKKFLPVLGGNIKGVLELAVRWCWVSHCVW